VHRRAPQAQGVEREQLRVHQVQHHQPDRPVGEDPPALLAGLAGRAFSVEPRGRIDIRPGAPMVGQCRSSIDKWSF
jgi:hypothetical protein